MALGPFRARKKSSPPKALHAVARQRLLVINGLLDEVSRNYVARLHREIAELNRLLEQRPVFGTNEAKRKKGLRTILKKIERLQINPERGRRKDLKKIDTLIGEIQAIVEKW